MDEKPADQATSQAREFEREAQGKQKGTVSEFVAFLAYNKKWWLTPIVIVLLLVAAVLMLGGTGAAPFIYTLF